MALFCSKTIALKVSFIFLSILGLVSTFALATECNVKEENNKETDKNNKLGLKYPNNFS